MSRAARLKATGPFRDGFELPDHEGKGANCGGAPQATARSEGETMQEPTPEVADEAPSGPEITAYDRQHFVTYLRLLDAKADGADWQEVARIVLDRDPDGDEWRSRRCWRSHLDRAEWFTREGYRLLLEQAAGNEIAGR